MTASNNFKNDQEYILCCAPMKTKNLAGIGLPVLKKVQRIDETVD